MKIMQSSFACPRHLETTSTASPANQSPQRWVDLIHFVNERDRQKTGEQDRAGPVRTTEITGAEGSLHRNIGADAERTAGRRAARKICCPLEPKLQVLKRSSSRTQAGRTCKIRCRVRC